MTTPGTTPHLKRPTPPTTVISLKGRLRAYGPSLEHAPEDVVYVGRRLTMGGWNLVGHPLSNPYTVKQCGTPENAVNRYRAHLLGRPDLLALVPALRGKTLACWCAPQCCHADVLAKLADARPAQPAAPPTGRRAPKVAAEGVLSALGSDSQDVTVSGILPGLQVRMTSVPVADWLCRCGHHERARGKAAVMALTARVRVGDCPHTTERRNAA